MSAQAPRFERRRRRCGCGEWMEDAAGICAACSDRLKRHPLRSLLDDLTAEREASDRAASFEERPDPRP